MSTPTSLKIEQLITEQLSDAITKDGYAVIEHFLSTEQIAALGAEAKLLQQAGNLRPAGIGRQQTALLDEQLRGDCILWLDEKTASSAQQAYLSAMQGLREQLNRDLYLGLFEFETHFAIYPAGGVYKKHLDQFQASDARQISTILYLNHDWQADDGGQLRLYLDGTNPEPYLDIEPLGGKLVTFLSGRFYHEVLPARRERISITGWFRTRPDTLPH
jgi:SM-20-related protein